MPAPLRVACLALSATSDPVANAEAIVRGLDAAAAAGARVLATPECGLTGYPGAARSDLAGLDPARLADLEHALARHAAALGLVVVLGTASPHADGWSDDALACGAIAPVRHRKRALTPGDRAHFRPGSAATAIAVDGWRLGLAVCYEVRFPELWEDADGFVCLAHMAGVDTEPGVKAQVVPTLFAARAAEWAAPLALANTADADRWLDGGLWDARGLPAGSSGAGLAVATLAHRDELPGWYAGLRRDRLALRAATPSRTSSPAPD